MTRNLDSKKLKLIEAIASIKSEKDLDELEIYLKQLRMNRKHGEVFKGIRKTTSIKELKKEQKFKKFDRSSFDQLVKKMNIQEPVEELLGMLN